MKLYLHELGVVSRVDHDAVHPLGVAQLSAPQQDLVWAQWDRAAARAPITMNKPHSGNTDGVLCYGHILEDIKTIKRTSLYKNLYTMWKVLQIMNDDEQKQRPINRLALLPPLASKP